MAVTLLLITLLFESNHSGIETITLEYLCFMSYLNLNRTIVELRLSWFLITPCIPMKFESNHSGIETLLTMVAQEILIHI